MDFLDPHKRRVQKTELIVGYVLICILLGLGTIILLYQAYGFGLGKNGRIIQNGFVFVSSTPSPANIYINHVAHGATDSRLNLPSGQYLLQLNKTGYRQWSRGFNVDGGSVQHFDYPFLVPSKLVTKTTAAYTAQPSLVLQSPDRRWLLVEQPGAAAGTFQEFDSTNIKTAPVTLTIPATVLGTAPGTLAMVQWSTDNNYVILSNTTASGVSYILFDRQAPADSVNLSVSLALPTTTTEVQFINNVYNEFYIYDGTAQTLSSVSISAPTLKPLLTNVLAFKSYGSSMLLYASSKDAPAGETAIRLLDGTQTYNLMNVASSPTYLLNFAQNNSNWFYAIGSSSENKVYIFENPEQTLQNNPNTPLVPVDILKVNDPNYVNFSADTTMIMVENGTQFSVYDDFNDKDYNYKVNTPLDAPQLHAIWMNGEQIVFVSNGKLVMLDYDGTNQQTLASANANSGVFFDQPYKYYYTVGLNTGSDATTNPFGLNNIALRIPSDL